MRPFGFNVIGHVSANAGLGVVARSAIRLILNKGYPLATFDVDPGHGRGQHDATYSEFSVGSIDALPYGINLVILSMTALPDVLLQHRIPLRDDVISAGFFWWELPALSDIWIKSLEQFDVLVAGSHYLRSTFERFVAETPTIAASHALQPFDDVRPDRPKFGLPGDKTVFVCIVEPTSDPIRKNPFAVVEAFRRAFSQDDSAHLVVKVNNVQADRESSGLLRQLRREVASLGPRATLIEQVLPYGDVLQLYSSCDVFVSLHRAEGLGLGLMEAMALGKPVIATGWSGNMTFMNHLNSCIVGFRLIPVGGSLKVYSRAFLKQEVHWAEPDLEEAAAWMRALERDPALRTSIGSVAAEDMRRYRVEAERGTFLDELRAMLEHFSLLPNTRTKALEASLSELRDAQFESNAGTIRRVLRKIREILNRHFLWRIRSRDLP
jgi:glycosyltransferase involved in cell wall biosynthesis